MWFARPPTIMIARINTDSISVKEEGSMKVMYDAKREPPTAASAAETAKMVSLKYVVRYPNTCRAFSSSRIAFMTHPNDEPVIR